MAECVEEECEGTSMNGVPRDVEIGEHKLRQVSSLNCIVFNFFTQGLAGRQASAPAAFMGSLFHDS